jgi:hypothetical protein
MDLSPVRAVKWSELHGGHDLQLRENLAAIRCVRTPIRQPRIGVARVWLRSPYLIESAAIHWNKERAREAWHHTCRCAANRLVSGRASRHAAGACTVLTRAARSTPVAWRG